MKIVITGASGFLGQQLMARCPADCSLIPLYHKHPIKHPNAQKIDLSNDEQLRQFMKNLQADVIIHAAAISSLEQCEQDQIGSYNVNVYGSLELADLADVFGIPLLFISTDQVFNGLSAPYVEDDFAYPINQYGLQKQTVEESLYYEYTRTAICRLPLLYGWDAQGRNFLQKWLKTWKAGKIVAAFEDETRSPLSVTAAADWIFQVARFLKRNPKPAPAYRLWHLAGSEALSRVSMARKIQEVWGLTTAPIRILKRADADMLAPRPANVALESSAARGFFKFNPPSFDESLQLLRRDYLSKK